MTFILKSAPNPWILVDLAFNERSVRSLGSMLVARLGVIRPMVQNNALLEFPQGPPTGSSVPADNVMGTCQSFRPMHEHTTSHRGKIDRTVKMW